MNANTVSIMGRARQLLKDLGFDVGGPSYKTPHVLKADVTCNVEHGTIRFELLVGKLSAEEHIVVNDLRIFCPALQEAIVLFKPYTKSMRVSVFRTQVGRNTYFLELLLLSDNADEVVLSVELNDHLFNSTYVEQLLSFNGRSPFETKMMIRKTEKGVNVAFEPQNPTDVPLEGYVTDIGGYTPAPGMSLTYVTITIGDKWFNVQHLHTWRDA